MQRNQTPRHLGIVLVLGCCAAWLPALGHADGPPEKQATPPAVIRIAAGFQVELVHTALAAEGSWISMAVDDRGRFWVSPQDGEPLRRLTVDGQGRLTANEPLPLEMSRAMGLLWMRDALYVSGDGPAGHGLYRVRDTNGDDQLDDARLLRQFAGRVDSEHGCHALVAGPDGMLYVAQGNHVPPPEDVSPTSPYRHFAEDQLLPSANYGVSAGDKARMPCGHVLRMDAEARQVELFAGGMRNAYDLAFNPAGQMFVFDSDTEFSWGLPWHQPTRILHVVSGGDYGFREGAGKFPAYYEDTLPPVVEIGLGSPTGVKFGTQGRFPRKYQQALFAADWTLGRIYAVHLTKDGASYRGQPEIFLEGHPLNVTDIEFGHDGCLYFTTGGRKTVGAIYRVRYVGPEATSLAKANQPEVRQESLRPEDALGEIDDLWRRLGSGDRFVRYAARVAVESQPVAAWAVLDQEDDGPRAVLTALLALARTCAAKDVGSIYSTSNRFPCRQLAPDLVLQKLRVIQVALCRHGAPSEDIRADLLRELDPMYPSADASLNRELAQLLIYLEAPGIVTRVVETARTAKSVEEQIELLFYLRNARHDWSDELRRTYFELFLAQHRARNHRRQTLEWFRFAGLPYSDGASFTTYLTNIRGDAMAHLSSAERAKLDDLLRQPTGEPIPRPVIVPRSFVQAWTSSELASDVQRISESGDAQRGREIFAAAQCLSCHRSENRGGAAGPDLTTIAKRLGPRDLLESILEPSRVVSDQFRNSIIEYADGRTLVGRVTQEDDLRLVVATDATSTLLNEIPRGEIVRIVPSPVSPMPEGLLNSFTRQDVRDLMAFLLADMRGFDVAPKP